MPTEIFNPTEKLDQNNEILNNVNAQSTTPDEYRELCLRKLSLRIAQVIDEIKDLDSSLDLSEELYSLVALTEPLETQESFTSTASDDLRRTRTLTNKENKLFTLLRQISWKLMLIFEKVQDKSPEIKKKLLSAKQQVAISNVRFAEQCTSNPIVKNKHVAFARVTSFLNLAIVDICKGELKHAEENLAKARFSWSRLREKADESMLCKVGTEVCNQTDYEDLDLLGVNILHVQGLLSAAKQDMEEALRIHALEIISSSRKYKNLPYVVSRGYYRMANIFFKQQRVSEATSYFMRTAELWSDYLGEKSSGFEKLRFCDKQMGIQNLENIIQMYEPMSEHVRNRDECLNASKQALESLKAC